MALKLVSSGDDRALAIRDHLLPLVREHGTLEVQRGPVRLVVLRTGPWTVEHWTPFAELSRDEASSPGYRHALGRQRAGHRPRPVSRSGAATPDAPGHRRPGGGSPRPRCRWPARPWGRWARAGRTRAPSRGRGRGASGPRSGCGKAPWPRRAWPGLLLFGRTTPARGAGRRVASSDGPWHPAPGRSTGSTGPPVRGSRGR